MPICSRAAASPILLVTLALCGCGNPVPNAAGNAASDPATSSEASGAARDGIGTLVKPPFPVQGELEGMLLVWFDEQGTHTASRRADVPEARRAVVRIDSLGVAPDKRLDPEHVYIADLSSPSKDGSYPVRENTRAWFDARVIAARPAPKPEELAQANADVTIYMASWCGACRAAASYLRSRNVSFAERDIEKDSEANAEMQRKAHAAGKSPSGVPVIDFRGKLILGFDRQELARLIDQPTAI